MREEHTQRPDSHVEFSTPNSGLTTTPAKEWQVVILGGSGCTPVPGKDDGVIVTGTRGCCKDGTTQSDLRVVRTMKHYGDFGADGRLKWGEDDVVVVGEDLTAVYSNVTVRHTKEVEKDTEGTVLEFNGKGAAKIAFREPVSESLWVSPDQFYRLYPRPSARDTPIQRLVKQGRLRRCDVVALVLYTGVCVPVCELKTAVLSCPCPTLRTAVRSCPCPAPWPFVAFPVYAV
jgi:hypothetical protein